MSIAADYGDPTTLPASEAARVARLLALKRDPELDDVGLARIVSGGLKPASAIAVGKLIANVLERDPLVPEATLRRAQKERKRLSRDHSERLYEIGRVIDSVGRLFRGDAASIQAFLTRPHPMLDGDTPIAMARSGAAGCTAVLNLVHRAQAGMVV